MTLKELAQKLLILFGENGEYHCKEYAALDKHGFPVSPTDPKACKFCILGGITHLMDDVDYADLHKLQIQFASIVGANFISFYNDRNNFKTIKKDLERIRDG